MMVRGSLPSLIQGISQQVPSIRPTSYIEDGTNVFGTIVEGLTRRPTTDYLGTLAGMGAPVAHHWIDRDVAERYFVSCQSGFLKVWDLAGNAKTVNAPDGWGYITGATNVGFLTVNDFTYVYNRDKVVHMDGTTAPGTDHLGLVWIRQGDYATTYKIRVGYPASSPTWYEATYTTDATDATTIKLEHIQQQLAAGLTGVLPVGFSVGSRDYAIWITRSDPIDYLLEAVDDATGKDMVVNKDSVADITELSAIALQDMVLRIRQSEGNLKDDWWAKFTATDGIAGPGYWTECPMPGSEISFDYNTMPFLLVRESDGTFTFRHAAWGTRTSGGATFQPPPSFVGRVISNMRAMKGRITITSGGSFVTTRAADPFNFWQRSVQLLEDDDPIDVNPSYVQPYTLTDAAEFQKGVLLFADNVQFIITSGDIFGPKTIGSKPISSYTLAATKGTLGLQQDRVCVATQLEGYTGLLTFVALSQTTADMTFDDTSAVVPALIPGTIVWIDGSSTQNMVVMRTDDSNALYSYKESRDGGKVIQSAWNVWRYASRLPVSGKFIGSQLYLVLRNSNNVYTIERMTLQPFKSGPLAWDIFLDRRVTVDGGDMVASVASTAVTLPWTATAGETVYLVITSGPQLGAVVKASSTGTLSATFPGLFSGIDAVVGVQARATAELSTIYFRKLTRNMSGEEVVTEGALQLTRGKVSYAKSGPFQVVVQPLDRPTPSIEQIADPMFEDADYVSPQDLQTGSTDFPIGAFNERVTITFDSGESPMPMRVTSFEWKGDLNLQARPI